MIPARALAILALSLGLIAEARRGACMTSLFEFEDTRDLAWRWLERHGPSLSRVGFEKYTGPVAQDTSAEVGRVRQVETQGWNALRASGCEFVVRSPDPRAGGVFNPCTVTRFPACRDAFDEFVADAERLRVWAPLPPDSVKATFCSPEIELWGLRKDVRLRDLPIELPRPSRISLSGKECFFPVGCGLGSACAIEVGRGMRKIVVGGGGRRSPVYVVATSGAEPVRLRLKGCGRVRTVDLWSNDVQVVSFPRPAWLPRFRKYEQIVAEPVPTGAGERRDCFLRLAFSPEEAAQICVQRRREGRAVEFLDMGEVAMRRPALAYRVALRTEAWDLAARLQSVAEGLRAAMDAALTNEVLRLRVGGVDGGCYDEFARLRFAGDWEETEAAVAGVRTGESPRSGRYRKTLRFPALIPAGRFSLRLTLDIFDPGIDGVLSFVNSDGVSVALADRQDVKEGRLTVTVPLIGGQEERLALFLESETPFACRLTEAELTWSLRDALAAAHRDLRSSLAWHRKKETVR